MIIYSTILTTLLVVFLAKISYLFVSEYKKKNSLRWLLLPWWMKVLTYLLLPLGLVVVVSLYSTNKLEEFVEQALEEDEE